ncbi:prosalusin-like isoform X2 [Cyprinus carpio]|uniref:Prosalusin-like isoform X2 n=1 Tax=Cyprinus carpio TaxID=7962 RepID=A0A9Q9Y2Z1_CYPCA|nr:prosalusin-like isoform X2 [Cyprinus carpio]
MIFILILIYCTSLGTGFEMKSIFCSISDSCDCDFKADIKGLEWDLYKNLYGQHMAQDIVSEAVVNFLQNENPDRSLVLSFHGASGTGKSLVSSMMGRHIYETAMGSPYIHQFVPTLHFTSADRVQQYRSDLKRWVEGNLTACARSIFIFDEMEKMPPGVIDVLEPHLGTFHVLFQTNYRKAIYIFIRWVLPLQNNYRKAYHPFCAFSSLAAASRGALCPAGALPAWGVSACRCGFVGRGRHDLHTERQTIFLQHWLQISTGKS